MHGFTDFSPQTQALARELRTGQMIKTKGDSYMINFPIASYFPFSQITEVSCAQMQEYRLDPIWEIEDQYSQGR